MLEEKKIKLQEVLKNQPYDGIKADIFSLGQILFNIVTAHFGFTSSASNNEFYKLIRLRNFELYWGFFAQFNLNLSKEFKDLFIIMVDPVPSERPTIDKILNDTWIREINNLGQEQMIALENEVRNEFQNRAQNIQDL